jgi:3-oxoacyl-[acyl-carrier protein] reductase
MANTIDLRGRNAVVTGGAQGIGRAIVERLLGSGASVAIWDRDGALAEQAPANSADAARSRALRATSPSSSRSKPRAMRR